jgi:mRNA interferase MazF
VLSVNPMDVQLPHVAVIPVTGTQGPEQAHVPLGTDAGLTRYGEFHADVTNPQPATRERLLPVKGRSRWVSSSASGDDSPCT